jgi:hypothetical protein
MARFETPLRQCLPDEIGHVDGGGTWLHGASDVWIYTSDLTVSLVLIRLKLIELGAPNGTQLQFSIGRQHFHDVLQASGWTTGLVTSTNILGLAFAA